MQAAYVMKSAVNYLSIGTEKPGARAAPSDMACALLNPYLPHVAFEVTDLSSELAGREILIPPNSPSDGVRVAFIVENGAPIELLEFTDPKRPARLSEETDVEWASLPLAWRPHGGSVTGTVSRTVKMSWGG
jgi:hypothetical protein